MVVYDLGNLRYGKDYSIDKPSIWTAKSNFVKLSLEDLKEEDTVKYGIPLSLEYIQRKVYKVNKDGFIFNK